MKHRNPNAVYLTCTKCKQVWNVGNTTTKTNDDYICPVCANRQGRRKKG